MVTIEDVDYDKAFKEFVKQMKDIIKNEEQEIRLEYGKDFKHEIVYPSNGSKPIHRFSWLNTVGI